MIISGISSSRFFIALSLVVIAFSLVLIGSTFARIQPINKVAIIIDSSGSFHSRYNEAVQKAVELLKGISQVKTQRWETADEIVLISLDAMPEVIWKGTPKELKAKGASFWTARFRARRDYSRCTDVSAAFRLAGQHLSGDSGYVHKYIFVFSDLISEPPGSSIHKPRLRSYQPPKEFTWNALKDVSITAFWVPANQKLLWQRAAQQHGLSGFVLYTPSESPEVAIQPPPRPIHVYTEEERQATRKRYIRYGKFVLAGIGIFVVMLLGLLIATWLLLRRRRQLRQGTDRTRGRIFGSRTT